MLQITNKILCPTLILLFVSAAFGGDIIECSAELVNVKNGQVAATYFMKEKKLRIEEINPFDGTKMVKIIRLDEGKVYRSHQNMDGPDRVGIGTLEGGIMPSYMELAYLDAPTINPSDHEKRIMEALQKSKLQVEVENKKIGTETVNGYQTEKFLATQRFPPPIFGENAHTDITNDPISAYEWVAKEFYIPVRMQLVGDSNIYELRVKPGPQPDTLFEIPAVNTTGKK